MTRTVQLDAYTVGPYSWMAGAVQMDGRGCTAGCLGPYSWMAGAVGCTAGWLGNDAKLTPSPRQCPGPSDSDGSCTEIVHHISCWEPAV